MEPVKTFTAKCTSCAAVYTAEVPAKQHGRAKAAGRNLEVWMQTHCDTTGHTRFHTEEVYSAFRIFSTGGTRQMVLSEDENWSTFTI